MLGKKPSKIKALDLKLRNTYYGRKFGDTAKIRHKNSKKSKVYFKKSGLGVRKPRKPA